MRTENPEQRTDRIEPKYIVARCDIEERTFAVHQTLADQRDISFIGEIQAISKNQAIVENRKQDESRGCDEAIPSSIQCIHLKFWNRSGVGPFDFRVK